MQMFISGHASGPVVQTKTPFERATLEKNAVDVFIQPEATMGWKSRTKNGRQEPSNVQLTRQAGKVAIYATTQLQCAMQNDDMAAFKSVIPDLHICNSSPFHSPRIKLRYFADQYGKCAMHSFSLARCLQQCEFGFGTTGLALYPDANTVFDFEANNQFVNLLDDSELQTMLQVSHYRCTCSWSNASKLCDNQIWEISVSPVI
jgi:hypothetical protein